MLRGTNSFHEPLHASDSTACSEPVDDHCRRLLDNSAEAGPVNRHERVAEVERDRADGRQVHPRQVATLDGQISRNGQYEQAIRSGLAV